MKLLFKYMTSIITFGVVASVAASETTNRVDVICHYMTWFRYQTEANGTVNVEHWKWSGKHVTRDPAKSYNGKTRDVYSMFYPRIGIYDSSDPAVIDYHILTAKAAGISTFVIDWYNPGDSVDKSFEQVLHRAGELDHKVAICYEEKTCFPDWNKIACREDAVAKAVKDFKYIARKYLNHPNYWKKNGKPVILVFAGWGQWPDKGKKIFTNSEWEKIIAATEIDAYIVLQNYKKEYPVIKSGFAWCGDRAYTKWFYTAGDRLLKDKKLDFYIGSVCPGFDDRGVWGWGRKPRFEAYLGTENFERYLNDFDASQADVIQVVTWNDFAEGTMIEPTVQFGNMYLEKLGQWSAGRNGNTHVSNSTLLPYKWFYLAKTLGPDDVNVKQIRQLLKSGKYSDADAAIKKCVATCNALIPPFIGLKQEFHPFSRNK